MDAGELVIKTVVDNRQVTKQLSNLKRMLKNEEKELEKSMKLQSKIEQDLEPYKEEIEFLKERKKYIDENNYTEQQKQTMYASLQGDLDILNNNYSEQLKSHQGITEQIKQQTENINKYKDAIVEVENIAKRGEILDAFKQQTKEIGKSIKSIGKMVLAIFGIRGAYMMVRNAINVITQDDAKLKADIDYMKNAIAYTLEPVVRTIVNLAKELMYAIQNIAYLITGKNIFANANKNLNKAAGSAKEIRKQLAGFDEMNILSNSSGGSGSTSPSMDLSKINEMSEQAKGLTGIILGIAGALSILNVSKILKNLGLIGNALSFTKTAGIGLIITGIYYIIKDVVDIWGKFDTTLAENGTTIKDWGKVVTDVGIIIGGIALLIGAWPVAVAAAIVTIIGLLMKNWDTIKKWFNEKVFGWMDKMIDNLSKTTIGDFFADIIRDSKRAIQEILVVFDTLFAGIKQIFDGILKMFKGEVKDGFITTGKGIINSLISSMNLMISGVNTVMSPTRELIAAFGKVTGKNWTIDKIKIPLIPKLAKGGILNMPGKGVPYGMATIAENGPEAVLPLTDSQQMERLASAIAERMVLRITNPIYLNGRLIAKEVNQANMESDFAYNR